MKDFWPTYLLWVMVETYFPEGFGKIKLGKILIFCDHTIGTSGEH